MINVSSRTGWIFAYCPQHRLSKSKNQKFCRQNLRFQQMLAKLHNFTAAGTLFPSLKINLGLKASYIKTFVYLVELIEMFSSELFSIGKWWLGGIQALHKPGFGRAGEHKDTARLPVCLSTLSPQETHSLFQCQGGHLPRMLRAEKDLRKSILFITKYDSFNMSTPC